MDRIESASTELREMEEMSALRSPVHSIHPLAKLLITIAYIICVVSFNKYDLSGLFTMVMYPVVMFDLSGLSVKTCFFKMKFVLPFVCFAGILNPFFDREICIQLGMISVSYGFLSMITLIIKGILCVMASFILIATTSVEKLCAGLRKLHIPSVMVALFLLCYRYITVMMDEVCVMTMAYKLRAPDQKGIKYTAWGSFLGQLILRSMDRAQELYSSMKLRGFNGEYRFSLVSVFSLKDGLILISCIVLFTICRCINIAYLLGSFFVH